MQHRFLSIPSVVFFCIPLFLSHRILEILHPFSDTIPHFWEPLDAEQEENNSQEIQELCKSDVSIKLSLLIP